MTGAAYAGGTRLRAVLAEASDGTASFFHFWDTELEVSCQFEQVDEPAGTWRCQPASAPVIYEGTEVFADAQCTAPLLRGTEPLGDVPRVVKRLDPQCGTARDYFRPGVPFTAATVYRKTETDCVPESVAAQDAPGFLTLERLFPSAFVAAHVAAVPARCGVAVGQLEAEDGSRAPHAFSDVTGGFQCWPRESVEGMRCLPTDSGWEGPGGFYSDALCSVPAAVSQRGCGDRRNALPFVFSQDASTTGRVTAVHLGGARLQQIFVQLGPGECSAGNRESVAYAIGEPVDLQSFAPAALSKVTRPSGLVQTVAKVGGVSVARFDELETEVFGGYRCTLAATPDGAVRCVPRIEIARMEYSDPACTQPIWQSDFDLVSIGSDRIEIETSGAGSVVVPSVDRVLVGATPHEGPVYAQRGTECAVVPGVPNARQPYRAFAREAGVAELPALAIVVR